VPVDSIPTVIITGPVGVGKTTVATAVADLLDAHGIPCALVDMDMLRSCFPRPMDDPFHAALGYRNLAAIWTNFRAAGAERLILADVVESSDLSSYRRAVAGADFTVVRLAASAETIAQRLHGRESGTSLAWHLDRAEALASLMEDRGIGSLVIDENHQSPADLAAVILTRIGWVPMDQTNRA
jgi:shikimate kinase